MYIVHHLATKSNVIEVEAPKFSTLHSHSVAQGVEHKGWAIILEYAGDVERMKKHKWEFVFSPEEAEQLCDSLIKMLPRFKATSFKELVGEDI